MTGSTPAAAARALRDTLQVLLSTVTTSVLRSDATGPATLLTAYDRLTRSSGGHVRLYLLHAFSTVLDVTKPRPERWQTRTIGYQYRLEDADGREIIAYHWHPHGRSHIAVPHLHLGAALGQIRSEMAKAHLRSGTITPVAVLAVAIEQFAVAPRRADWSAVFERTTVALADA